MTAVKEIQATEEFLGLDIKTRKCQTKETFEDCTTRTYLDQLEQKCGCVPYNLKNFEKKNQVFQSQSDSRVSIVRLFVC